VAREEGEEARRNEESDGDGRKSDHEEGAAGGSEKANCSFSAKKEERLVEFFSVNQAFYGDSRGHSEQELGEELEVHLDVSDIVPPRFTL
jgi:hypothetical protein